jgi:mono/diheme cytochrome c family protein
MLGLVGMPEFSPVALAGGLVKSTPALLDKGKASYKTNCLQCHGEKGDGNGIAGAMMNPKPRNFKTTQFKNGEKPEQIFKTLTDGLEGTAMASFRHLSDEERSSLVYYVLQLKK